MPPQVHRQAGITQAADDFVAAGAGPNTLSPVARGSRNAQRPRSTVPKKSCTARLNAAGSSRLIAWPVFGAIHNHFGWFPQSLEQIFGVIFAPIAWVIGIPKHDCLMVGNLLGTRMVLNELVAFSMLGGQKAALDPRSVTIATFALCGFANLSSIGIQIGGIGALAPNKRGELARLGVRAMLAGTMANLMSASIAGMLL